MRATNAVTRNDEERSSELVERQPLWQLDIVEVTGHNLESRGRKEVNRLLQNGWRLLHIYTLMYRDDGVWRQRPMAILGKLWTPAAAEGTSLPSRGRVELRPSRQELLPRMLRIDGGPPEDKK